MISEARERAADKQSDLEQERKLGWLKENRTDHILKSKLKWEVQQLWRWDIKLSLGYNKW